MIRRAFLILVMTLMGQAALAQQEPVRVKLVEVTEETGTLTRQFFGSVAARETVDLAFQVAGQIVELPLVEGQTLKQGDLVARLDLEPFELALDQARTQLDQAQRTVDRLQKLEGRTVSEVSVDDAQTQLTLANIAVRNAEYSLREASLRAPFDALVAARNVSKFTTVAAGTPVARLHDMSELRIDIDVPEVLFQRAGTDPAIELTALFPSSDRTFPLEVREYNAETSQVGQTFQITLGMTPPDNLNVLPGSSVTVRATLSLGERRFLIPASAVVTANDGATFAVLFEPTGADEGTVQRVPITIRPDANGNVEVTSGLEAGQEIVASGATQLEDGDSVMRFTGFSN